ncbi:hypothetical protein PRUPE_4G242500 [Prunus persica]|uniref:Uncharacterized protein n=1 Tax=Prunus persica TaxID=3760 RepID=M5XA19_PRUPE|nr:hypothetical protein PRUPE_4G242500 [Prunus persica]
MGEEDTVTNGTETVANGTSQSGKTSEDVTDKKGKENVGVKEMDVDKKGDKKAEVEKMDEDLEANGCKG